MATATKDVEEALRKAKEHCERASRLAAYFSRLDRESDVGALIMIAIAAVACVLALVYR